ncbi:protein EPIDERMAL PATTERNING FACTOR 1 [Citrus sinensis]|nr:protein EPIDERMAL PATTERNING FACTOR 1 [Citrus x clementina]XP_024948456.1 protein EPIDERMAL PATTERNING FACTOR 1 [Citrus sinensis]KAH9744123.1 protein EPIDERMAL PATTERNING FACTOR 1 [Citrus sinensis]
MKGSALIAVLFIALIFVPALISARHIGLRPHSHHGHHQHAPHSKSLSRDVRAARPKFYWERIPIMKRKGAETLQIAGSSLPDCSHACGSCSPCRLVMVSFVCASLEEAETCPMAYKCMCNNKSYPVP